MNDLEKNIREIWTNSAQDDSLDGVELCLALEEGFQISISDEEWQGVEGDVEAAIVLIRSKGGVRTSFNVQDSSQEANRLERG